MQDVKRFDREVAALNGIRVEPDDPLFARVTINRTVLEEATRSYRIKFRRDSRNSMRCRKWKGALAAWSRKW